MTILRSRDEHVARFDAQQAKLDEAARLRPATARVRAAGEVANACIVRLALARNGSEPLPNDLLIAYDGLQARAQSARRRYEDQLVREARRRAA